MLRKIKFKEFKDLYRKHIIKDFPENERANLGKFWKKILNNKEEIYIFEEDKIDKGYCIIGKLSNYIFVDFLATYKETRGQGIGTKILKELIEKYSNYNILLEVEESESAKNEKEKNIREKRIRFYEKSNFKIIKGVKINYSNFVTFNLMIYPPNEINKQQIQGILKQFYSNILDKKTLKNIKIKNIDI